MSAPKTDTPVGATASSLADVLGAAAVRAARLAEGSAALLLTADSPDSAPRLRAAAGLATPDSAREMTGLLVGIVQDVMHHGGRRTRAGDPRRAGKGPGGVLAVPLRAETACHGALVLLLTGEPSLQVADGLDEIARSAALRIDYEALLERVATLETAEFERENKGGENGDEILKLSEALFAQDIELLRNSEQLGSVQKLKSDFIEKMSRELRTPLNSIIEAIISVLAGENEQLSESAKGSLRCALDEGTAFLRTLQNILDLWRLKQGEFPIAAQEVNFREVVEEAIFSVQDTLGDKPVVIEKKIVEPLPKVRTDLAKVNQILFLLLDNAAKFIEGGRIEIGAEVRDDHLHCSIEDTGIGICADDREYIFEEFFQVDDTPSATYRGAGLGLTLVRDLLDLLSGEIELESEIGRGTVVRFKIPVQLV